MHVTSHKGREKVRKIFLPILLGLVLVCILFVRSSFPQEGPTDIEDLKKTAPKVFIDCGSCDIDHIRTEITYVNYVRDRKEADVHVLVTSLRTGSGGREYTLAFIGQNRFEGVDDTHKYFTETTNTEDEIREGMAKALKVGLMSYVAKTPISSRIRISYKDVVQEAAVKDKWNYWVFKISGNGRLSGEEYYKSKSISGSFSASRVTPELKISLSLYGSHYKQDFEYDSTSLESIRESLSLGGLVVKSINDHWSYGAYFDSGSSTYENIKFGFTLQPAIEFNLFPYSESTRRQLRFLYRIGFNSIRYREETIYDKFEETLWNQSLSITFDIKEKWGSISTTFAGSHYFHDTSKYRLTLFNILSIRVIKGLNFFAFGGGSRIHDQLSLAKGDISLDELLLRRKQIATGYNYFFSVGLSFTFGSIFTNVVNPRFGSHGYGGMHIIID
jgi:hypothetical protein